MQRRPLYKNESRQKRHPRVQNESEGPKVPIGGKRVIVLKTSTKFERVIVGKISKDVKRAKKAKISNKMKRVKHLKTPNGQKRTITKREAMKILALDFGTKCGWAIGNPGDIISDCENFRCRASDSRGMIFVRFDKWINEMLSEHKPALVVHERPHLRGRAPTEVLNGMLAFMVKACRVHGVQYTDCPSTTLKKYATGKGNASKDKMVKAYREKWKEDPIDDNEADARWLLEWAQKEFGT